MDLTLVNFEKWVSKIEEVNAAPPVTNLNIPLSTAEARQLLSQINQLQEFAKIVIQVAFEGGSLDGGEIQGIAVEHGLLTETVYDPEKHGEDSYAEPGDPWFVFSEVLGLPKAIESTESARAE